jgi:hypothetical protein
MRAHVSGFGLACLVAGERKTVGNSTKKLIVYCGMRAQPWKLELGVASVRGGRKKFNYTKMLKVVCADGHS